jgi:hypothetical protein
VQIYLQIMANDVEDSVQSTRAQLLAAQEFLERSFHAASTSVKALAEKLANIIRLLLEAAQAVQLHRGTAEARPLEWHLNRIAESVQPYRATAPQSASTNQYPGAAEAAQGITQQDSDAFFQLLADLDTVPPTPTYTGDVRGWQPDEEGMTALYGLGLATALGIDFPIDESPFGLGEMPAAR